MFFERSPRHLSMAEAQALRINWPEGLAVVALTVNATDEALDEIIRAARPDWLQLHGTEEPSRVAAVKRRFGLPVMKAVGIGDTADLARAACFADVADMLLLDAKPPADATLPGGNGLVFDWHLLADFAPRIPWLLAGGLDVTNVSQALRMSGAPGVDVSSGVESASGVKDTRLIQEFIDAARTALDACAPTP